MANILNCLLVHSDLTCVACYILGYVVVEQSLNISIELGPPLILWLPQITILDRELVLIRVLKILDLLDSFNFCCYGSLSIVACVQCQFNTLQMIGHWCITVTVIC